jgi:hypothetical protein
MARVFMMTIKEFILQLLKLKKDKTIKIFTTDLYNPVVVDNEDVYVITSEKPEGD